MEWVMTHNGEEMEKVNACTHLERMEIEAVPWKVVPQKLNMG
jgi:hypothetical protein